MITKKKLGSALAAVVALVSLMAGVAGAEEVKGKVKAVVPKTKTISLVVENKGVMVFRLTETSALKNAKELKEIQPDDALAVEFTPSEQGNIATVVTRVFAKLPPGVGEIKADELAALIGKGDKNYLLVDSRPVGKYNEGHIPTAVSIPFTDLEKSGEKLLPADRKTPLIFYCGGLTCVLSPKSAALAQKLGYTNVRVFAEGEPGWKKAERETEASLEFVKTANIVLVDLRDPETVAKGHIPRGVNIPANRLAAAERMFPAYKGAAIVFYGDKEADLLAALELMRDWGYGKATLFSGGAEAWQGAGNPLATGPAADQIVYARKLGPGEIGVADFEKALKSGSAVMVDARSAEEYGKGHLKGSVNIPAEEVAKRFGELPKDKPVVTFCSTGSRAEMAYDVLKDKPGSVTFLKPGVEIGPDGNYTIAE